MKFDVEKPYDYYEFGIKEKGEGGKHFLACMIPMDKGYEREDTLDKRSQVVDQSQLPTGSDAYCYSGNLDPLSCRNDECGWTGAPYVDATSENTVIAKEDLLYRDKMIIEVGLLHSLLHTGNGVCPTLKDICFDEVSQSSDKESNFVQQTSANFSYVGIASIQESPDIARNHDVKAMTSNEGLGYLKNTLEDQVPVAEDMQRIMIDSTNKDKNSSEQQSSSKLMVDLKKSDTVGSIASEMCVKEISEKQALSRQELGTTSIIHDSSDVIDSRIEYQHVRLKLDQAETSSEHGHSPKEEKTAKLFAGCTDIDLQKTDEANVASDDAKLHSVPSNSNLDIEEASNVCVQNKKDAIKEENFLSRNSVQSEELVLDGITSPCSSFSNLSLVESSMYHSSIFSGPVAYSGHIPFSGNISLRSESSTASTCSFAFPILQSEWNCSPVKMVKADRKQLRKVRGWKRLACCKF